MDEADLISQPGWLVPAWGRSKRRVLVSVPTRTNANVRTQTGTISWKSQLERATMLMTTSENGSCREPKLMRGELAREG